MPHHRKMTGVAMAILGDAEDVRDCMQDTLSKLWMIRGELGQKVNIEAYCMRTVRNNSLTILKRRRNDDSVIPDLEERLNPEVMLENKDRLAKVLKGIELLPDIQRRVMKLATITGLPPDDIAKMLGISSANVRKILSRARIHLKNLVNNI